MSQFKVLGQPIEEFLIRWNATSFYVGGLSQKFSNKLSRIYMNELKTSLASNKITLEDFFINLSRGGSISTMRVEDANTPPKIKDFYRNNLWGTSIPYTIPIAFEMSPEIKGKNVLDVGCGFGRLSILSALKGAQSVTAIDLSVPLINTLEQTILRLKLNNIETHIMDAENLRFKPHQFDIIYLCEVIEHLVDPIKTLKQIRRLLKPRGCLILSTPNSLNVVGFKQQILSFLGVNWISPYGLGQPELHSFTPMSMRNLLSKCGFEIETLRGTEYVDNFAIIYPSHLASGLVQFIPLLFPIMQKFKKGLVKLGKTGFFRNFGLEMFIHARVKE